jgi:hypothetical protein
MTLLTSDLVSDRCLEVVFLNTEDGDLALT